MPTPTELARQMIPDHECTDAESCAYPRLMMLLAYDNPDGPGVITDIALHLLSIDTVTSMIVRLLDSIAEEATNMPPKESQVKARIMLVEKLLEDAPIPSAQ